MALMNLCVPAYSLRFGCGFCAVGSALLVAWAPVPAVGQVRAAMDGTGTTVVLNGNEFSITNGSFAGSNQFHSFDQFDLRQGRSAHFRSPAHVKNILGRITAAEPSTINGSVSYTHLTLPTNREV